MIRLHSMRPPYFNGAAIIAICVSSAVHAQTIFYVDDDAQPGGNGMSWNTAFDDLQNALAAATGGDKIRIGQGTYTPAPPTGPRTAAFQVIDGLTLRGGYAGALSSTPGANDPEQYPTILSGDLNGDDEHGLNRDDNSFHVIFGSGLTRATRLLGLVVRGGNADYYGEPEGKGGGAYFINFSSPTIRHCKFIDNRAIEEGGGVNATNGAPLFQHCTFIHNSAFKYPPQGRGGGLRVSGAAEIYDCQFIGNHATHNAGAILGSHSGMIIRRCYFKNNGSESAGAVENAPLAIDCIFENNHAMFGGAGYRIHTAVNCVFRDNATTEWGGALVDSSLLVNCLFVGNSTDLAGGAIYSYAASMQSLINCTIVGNSVAHSDGGGGGIDSNSGFVEPANVTLNNCVIWANRRGNAIDQAAQIQLSNSKLTVADSCIMGWTGSLGGTGNHGNDPRFVDAPGPDGIFGTVDDDLRLLANSPLINRGNNMALPPDTYDLDGDGNTAEPLSLDFDELPRIVGGVVDVGAYEFQGIPCLPDIDGTGGININDLLAVINAWGSCVPGETCNVDLTLDGVVDSNDLLLVIDGWGICP